MEPHFAYKADQKKWTETNFAKIEIPTNITVKEFSDGFGYAQTLVFTCYYKGNKVEFAIKVAEEVIVNMGPAKFYDYLLDRVRDAFSYKIDEPLALECLMNKFHDTLVPPKHTVKFSDLHTAKFSDFNWSLTNVDDNSLEVSRKAAKLPGMDVNLSYPCGCVSKSIAPLFYIIQHLNDSHTAWTRECIADWIDELHEAGAINAEFQPWEEDAHK